MRTTGAASKSDPGYCAAQQSLFHTEWTLAVPLPGCRCVTVQTLDVAYASKMTLKIADLRQRCQLFPAT